MPYQYVEPELYYECNGIKIYHCYKHEDFENEMLYWFDTSREEGSEFTFDIRDYGVTIEPIGPASYGEWEEWRQECVRAAIDSGKLKMLEDWQMEEACPSQKS